MAGRARHLRLGGRGAPPIGRGGEEDLVDQTVGRLVAVVEQALSAEAGAVEQALARLVAHVDMGDGPGPTARERRVHQGDHGLRRQPPTLRGRRERDPDLDRVRATGHRLHHRVADDLALLAQGELAGAGQGDGLLDGVRHGPPLVPGDVGIAAVRGH